MTDHPHPTHHPPPDRPGRPRYRLPVGLPRRDEGRREGAIVSVLLHVVIIGMLIIPFFLPTGVIQRMQQGAGGAGPAGGGGGGTRGTGGERTVETLRFVKVGTQAVPTPSVLPPVTPPVVPVVPLKPADVPPPTPTARPAEQAQPSPSAPSPATPTAGTGGGSGSDGTAGAGPGSGGGTGAGIGTGRGSGTGAGTGGGNEANYSPVPVRLFLPPLPAPASVRGYLMIAEFDVDSVGRVIDFKFTPSPDGSYNRQLATMLRSVRFRPGTRPDGTPIRMKAQISFGPL